MKFFDGEDDSEFDFDGMDSNEFDPVKEKVCEIYKLIDEKLKRAKEYNTLALFDEEIKSIISMSRNLENIVQILSANSDQERLEIAKKISDDKIIGNEIFKPTESEKNQQKEVKKLNDDEDPFDF